MSTSNHVNYIVSSSSATHLATFPNFLTSPSFHDFIGIVLSSSLPTSSPFLDWFFVPPFLFFFTFSRCPLLFIFFVAGDIDIVHGQVRHPVRFFLFTITNVNASKVDCLILSLALRLVFPLTKKIEHHRHRFFPRVRCY